MGMHEGILCASAEWATLHSALLDECGTIELQQSLTPDEWLNFPQGQDALHVISQGGHAYMLDPGMVLTANPDLAVRLSDSLGCSIVCFGAETVSGTYWVAVADKGVLRRLHWNVRSSLMQPLDLGEPLDSEGRIPLEDVDGNGLMACAAEMGFDPRVVTQPQMGGERYLWTDLKLPEAGPIQQQIDEHHKVFGRSDKEDWTKHIKPVPRADGGFDLQYQQPTSKPSLVKRIFGR